MYKELKDVHGEQFAKNMKDEFMVDDCGEPDGEWQEHREPVAMKLYRILQNKAIWYVAGAIDAMLVFSFFKWVQ